MSRRAAPTLADVCLIPQVYNAMRFACALDDYPLITAIWRHRMSLPAFGATATEPLPGQP